MIASIVDLADATAAELNGEALKAALAALGLPDDYTALRLNDPQRTEAELQSLNVIVTGASIERERSGRGSVQEDHEIGVAVMRRTDTRDNASTDPLIRLCEAFSRHFDGFELEEWVVARCEYPVLYVPEWFRQKNAFFGFVRLTWRRID